jgi:hypothetical protein
MLGAFLCYGVGSAVATAAAPAHGAVAVGALMMLVNSGLVICIGVLLYPVLRRYSELVATGYLATRLFEGTVMAVGIVGLLTLSAMGSASSGGVPSGAAPVAELLIGGNLAAYNVAMVGLGVGSLFLCRLLFTSRLVPRFLALWGFIGYAIFAAGCILELLGYTGAGLIATIPGGLWELFFAAWLIVKGFNSSTATAEATRQDVLVS